MNDLIASPSAIRISSYTYTNESIHTATLTVCYANPAVTPSSEYECSVDTVTATVNNRVSLLAIRKSLGDATIVDSIVRTFNISSHNTPITVTWGGGNFSGFSGSSLSVCTHPVAGSYK